MSVKKSGNLFTLVLAIIIASSSAECETKELTQIPIALSKYFGQMGEKDYPFKEGSEVEIIGASASGISILSRSAKAVRSQGSNLLVEIPVEDAKRINDFKGSLTVSLKADNNPANSSAGQARAELP